MSQLLTPGTLIIRITLALGVLLVVMLVCSMIGSEEISLSAVFDGLGDEATTHPDYEIFVRVRLPRIILACLVGAALACSRRSVYLRHLERSRFRGHYRRYQRAELDAVGAVSHRGFCLCRSAGDGVARVVHRPAYG